MSQGEAATWRSGAGLGMTQLRESVRGKALACRMSELEADTWVAVAGTLRVVLPSLLACRSRAAMPCRSNVDVSTCVQHLSRQT